MTTTATPFDRDGRPGPLRGLRVLEIASIGPGPFAGMLLADLGADVIRVDRPGSDPSRPAPEDDAVNRGRRSIVLDLKSPAGRALALDLAARADVLIEGFRPGVMERLGLGPDACLAANPALVYGRVTGWGQDGPLASTAGHDIGYIAVTGALHAIGPAEEPPPPPLNLVGDNAGGGMLLALGVLAAVAHARATGAGQVVDAAIVDGASLLTTLFHGRLAAGWWRDERGANLIDGGAPFYGTYRCADGRHLAVGAIEERFRAELLDKLGVAAGDPLRRDMADPASWPGARERIAAIIATRTRDEWARVLDGDACAAPVLSLTEAPDHPHLAARGTFTGVGGVRQPAPAPRFSATPSGPPRPAPAPGAASRAILAALGHGEDAITALAGAGVTALTATDRPTGGSADRRRRER
ncbi:CaiB/BaiF CoA transferase family protein [Actinomadura rugatobispora]|uniref:CaiB/BaiF CoA transferase family protein n=1 Tax=Actinomadura rugatobispora TaxID=1994 RepID=A0ABW0ZX22_9ACTN